MTDDEKDIVDAGSIMKKLIATPGWMWYTKNIQAKLDYYTKAALGTRGDSDWEKGAVFALGLVLNAPQVTIDEATRIQERDAKLRADEINPVKSEASP